MRRRSRSRCCQTARVLAVSCTAIPNAEKYIPATNTWVSAGSTPSALPQTCPGIVAEMGPTVVLPDGRAFVIGATGDTALYTVPANPSSPGTWQAGPTILDATNNRLHPIDAPAVLLPNGRVLLTASPSPPCSFPGPTFFFEYDPASNTLSAVGAPSNDQGACFTGRFLLLPNGQVLFSNQSSAITIYTPDGAPAAAWKPVITAVPPVMAVSHHYKLSGRQFNGLSEACCYGDDATMSTNYPIARLEQGANVHYCRTARHSTMAIATGSQIVSTILSIQSGTPPGNYNLVVIANGIPSDPVEVTIVAELPAIAVDLKDGGHFGRVCDAKSLDVEVFNVGDSDLIVDQVMALPATGPFAVEPLPTTPVTLKPGAEVEFAVTYTPTVLGTTQTGVLRITSNDPVTPTLDIKLSAATGSGILVTAIADNGDFGKVCVDSLRDEPLTLANRGTCLLTVIGIVSSSGAFLVPSVVDFPLTIAPGAAVDLPIQFQPTITGSVNATLTITSDDPAGTKIVRVSGTAPSPRLVPLVPDSGDFGKVCVGSFADEQLIVNNSGECTLRINGITSTSAEFLVPLVLAYPIAVGPGDSLAVPIRFQPTSFGAKTAIIAIMSNDPASPLQVTVSGEAPSGKIAVTGSTCFGGVPACSCVERTIAICNVGECDLHVSSVKFKRKNRHWKLVNSPFPATLHPGSCLSLVIRYKASEECPRAQELIILSDDPTTPVKELEVMAYTMWERRGCGKCDDCRRGDFHKCHGERHASCCCDDDDDDDDDHHHRGRQYR